MGYLTDLNIQRVSHIRGPGSSPRQSLGVEGMFTPIISVVRVSNLLKEILYIGGSKVELITTFGNIVGSLHSFPSLLD